MTATPKFLRFSLVAAAVALSLAACKNLPPPPPAAAAPPPPPAAPAPVQPRLFVVYFDYDKSDLTADGAKVVQEAAAYYKTHGNVRVKLDGYADLSGTQAYNLPLSHRRADTVTKAMVKEGVPASAITEAWHGEENPAVPTADGVREARNRRVEIME